MMRRRIARCDARNLLGLGLLLVGWRVQGKRQRMCTTHMREKGMRRRRRRGHAHAHARVEVSLCQYVIVWIWSWRARIIVSQPLPQVVNPMARKHAEDVALMVIEFVWSVSAELQEIVAKERLNTSKAQVSQLRAIDQQVPNALYRC